MSTVVKYDGREISPPPYLSRSLEPIDMGRRWGVAQNITLNGFLTGISGRALISGLCDIFATGFRTLNIESDGDASFYVANNCILDTISISSNPFYTGTNQGIPYTVTLKSYEVPSGVVDVSNEYSYSDNKDGTVGISRKVSAKGLKTTSTDAIDNAINFVSHLTGTNPVQDVSPIFISQGEPVLVSVSEAINRLDASYSVNETWKYETGSVVPYVTVSNLGVADDPSAEYVTLDLSVDFLSHKQSGIEHVRTYVRDYDYYDKLSKYGVNTGNCVLLSFSSEENPSASTISSKLSFISGESAMVSGLFYHKVSMNWDEIRDVRTYSLESEFKIVGPESHRLSRMNTIKQQIIADYGHFVAFAYNSLLGTDLYRTFKSTYPLNPLPLDFGIENNGRPLVLKFSSKFDDSHWKSLGARTLPNGSGYTNSIGKASWKVSVTPEMWLFEAVPAVNIEGHFIVQDLQCRTREKLQLESSVEHVGNSYDQGIYVSQFKSYTGIKSVEDWVLAELSSTNPNNSFYLTDSSEGSGVFNFNVNHSYYAKSSLCSGITLSKTALFVDNGYVRRAAGYQFGF